MRRIVSVVVCLLAVVASPAETQGTAAQQGRAANGKRELVFEIGGGVGFTSVDVEKWGGANSQHEELMATLIDARLLFHRAAGFQLGLEAGYRYFFYYEVPFGSNWLTRDVAATRLGFVARRSIGGMVSLDLGPAMYLFDGFTDLGASAGLVFRVPAGRVEFPVHVRTDLVFDEQLMIGSGATLSVAFRR